ncbi:MAG: EI24 domain-containing protein [Bacteroidetes bacterium]|nr:EI24 domain-containing protein [Bacteroidota bacterium]
MIFSKQVELGFRSYFNAIGFIFSKGLWWAFFIPLLLNILLFIGGYSLIENLTTHVQDWLKGILGLDSDSFFLSKYLGVFIAGFVWIFFRVLFFFVFAYYGGYIILILLSPLFAYLSAKTEEIISGKKYPFDGDQWMRDMVRGILIVLRNLFIQTGWIILMFVAGFIPVVGWFSAIVLFLVSAYFYGFSFIDYTSERRKLKIHESIQFVRANKWLAISNGFIFCLFLLLPFCGILFSGFAAIVAVVAATLAVNEISPGRE